MAYFLEGITTGILLSIGGILSGGFAIKSYFSRHPERLYTAIMHRKQRSNESK